MTTHSNESLEPGQQLVSSTAAQLGSSGQSDTGIKFGATCAVVETPVTGSSIPVTVLYDPIGVDTAGMPINQDGHQFTVTVTNNFILLQPNFTG